MEAIRLPPGNVSYIIQIRDLSALKDLQHEVGIDDLSNVRIFFSLSYNELTIKDGRTIGHRAGSLK